MKSLGYILSLVGVAGVVLYKKIATISFLKEIPKINTYTLIASVVLVILGLFFVMQGSSAKAEEQVPIYDKSGKKVVGYRKTK